MFKSSMSEKSSKASKPKPRSSFKMLILEQQNYDKSTKSSNFQTNLHSEFYLERNHLMAVRKMVVER